VAGAACTSPSLAPPAPNLQISIPFTPSSRYGSKNAVPFFSQKALFLTALFLTATGLLAQTPKIDPSKPVLTTAREVARHPSLSTELQPAVKLQASVTFIDPSGTVFLIDPTGSTFLRGRQNASYSPGQILDIEGVRFPGLYIGGIAPKKVTVLSNQPVPEPRKITLAELSTGQYHYEPVEIQGVGRSFEITGETTATLKLNVEGGILEVQFDQAPANGETFIDAELRVHGLAAGAINDHRQLVYPYLRVADAKSVTLVRPAPADAFETSATPLSSLLDFAQTGSALHRLKVTGIALGPVLDGNLFLRNGDRSIRIQTSQPVETGQSLEALGFPQMGNFSAILTDAVLKISPDEKANVEPIQADSKQLSTGSLDADLVTFEAVILQQLDTENALIVRTRNQTIRVLSPTGPLTEFAPGTRVKFTGIFLVTEAKHGNYRATPTGHELWLRSPQDAVVLSTPSWWNAKKLRFTLLIVGAAAILSLVWISILRRQVSRQLEVIRGKAQREAMIEERQRIAREFHDTLEQELAGLSLRLDAALPRVTDEKANSLLGQLRKLLFRLQTETRDFIWDLRNGSQHDTALPVSLETLIAHLQSTTGIPLILKIAENLPPLPALTQHHLLRITREAVHNAAKYSAARAIHIDFSCDQKILRLCVSDDGTGFDLSDRSNAPGHFGLQGMHERVRKLGAVLEIKSETGHGTEVEVLLDLSVDRTKDSL